MSSAATTKHTVVGDIPVGWGLVRISDIAKVKQGKTFSPQYQGRKGRWAWAKVGDMDIPGNGKWLKNVANYVDDSVIEELGIEPFPAYSTAFPRVGAALQTNKKRLLPVPMVVDDNVLVVSVCSESTCHREFLFYWFCSINLERQFSNAGPVPSIRGRTVLHTRIALPPLPEQRKIAEILSTWDRAIEQAEKLIEAKERLKKGLMQRLLTGTLRFPQCVGTPWRTCRLGEVFKERKETGRDDLPLLSITSDRGVIPRDEVDRKDTSNADKSRYKRIAPGDIGYNTMRMWQGVSAISALEGIVSPAYTVCTPKPGIDAEFAKHFFKFPPMVHLFWRNSQGLVDDTLSIKYHAFSRIKVTIPPGEEQRRIARVLSTVDREISVLCAQADALQQQKKGMMQKLLTGKVRVRT